MTGKIDPKKLEAKFSVEQLDWLLDKISAMAADLHAIRGALEHGPAASSPTARPVEIDLTATDSDVAVPFDIDKGAYAWTGERMKGKKLSECPPEFLDRLAAQLEAGAAKKALDPEKAKWAPRDSLLAAKARAWAHQKRRDPSPSSPGNGDGFVE